MVNVRDQQHAEPGEEQPEIQPASARTKTLWVRPEYLELILSGRKTVEVRVGYPNIVRLRRGDCLLLNGLHPFRVRHITAYVDFEALLHSEDTAVIAPDCCADDLLEDLRSIYPPEKESLGAYAIHLCCSA